MPPITRGRGIFTMATPVGLGSVGAMQPHVHVRSASTNVPFRSARWYERLGVRLILGAWREEDR